MTREDKQLLLKDICSRLPYHPNCYCKLLEKAPNGTNGCVEELSTFVIDEIEIMDDPQFKCQICDVKPYLRPMSSMTEEEKVEYDQLCSNCQEQDSVDYNITQLDRTQLMYVIDWLNEHHFDYRGLIGKGLALEAPDGMYNTKTE